MKTNYLQNTKRFFPAALMVLLLCFAGLTETKAQVPTGAINGLFSVAENVQVYFSQGNLQYIGSAGNGDENNTGAYWKFAEHQWDYFGDNGQGSDSKTVDRDLFGWGTSGYHDSSDPYNVNYYPWSTSTAQVNYNYNYYGFGPSTYMDYPNLTGSSAYYDWGVYNSISNGGNTTNTWRTLTQPEWYYLFYTRTTASGILYAKANVNNVNGVILLPDDWQASYYSLNSTNIYYASFSTNVITASQWAALELHGAVFLPNAGQRFGTSVNDVGGNGYYWSASHGGSQGACFVYLYDAGLSAGSGTSRGSGLSVRLVCIEGYYSINATPNPSVGGVVSGVGAYIPGAECTLTATPSDGFSFINWTENGEEVSTEPSYSFTVIGNRVLVANFDLQSSASNGVLHGVFSVGENNSVFFSQGNLQYIGSAGNGDENNTGAYWKFAEHQWDYLGDNGQVVNKTVDLDLFCWGTSGYNHGANCYQPWSTSSFSSDYYAYGSDVFSLNDQAGQADWGYNAISNGGNTENSGWRTLTRDEWDYLFSLRATSSGIRYALATVNNVNGVILLPDDWQASYYSLNSTNTYYVNYYANFITASQWAALEVHGAVFLPAAGESWYSYLWDVGNNSYYWSASNNGSDSAYGLYFDKGYCYLDANYSFNSRGCGLSVRLVRNVESSIYATPYPSEGGAVSGAGVYMAGTECTLIATPNEGYTFINWTEYGEEVSTEPAYSFTVTGNKRLVANFALQGSSLVPTGTLSGIFSVSDGQQVNFSQGNLQYIGSVAKGDENNTGAYWKFAEHQWDCLGDNGQGINAKTVDRDLFGWGTSGYNHGANCYQPWSTSSSSSNYYAYGSDSYNLNDQTGQANWGCNAIINGGNTANSGWRTLTTNEWQYLFYTRATNSGIRYAKATVNNVNGVILLPDDWQVSYYSLNSTNASYAGYSTNVITATQWAALEQYGAVFLPAAGYRDGASVDYVGSGGFYWSASYCNGNDAYYVDFFADYLSASSGDYRYFGRSVRLVRNVEKYSINATPSPAEGGAVNGAGTYLEGTECTLTATANTGYTFVNWTENGEVVSTDETYSFTVTGDRTLMANFSRIYHISVVVNPQETGSVSCSDGYIFDKTCYFDFEDGTMQGWTTLDTDEDGYTWYMPGFTGHNGSAGCVSSSSYLSGVGSLDPDNYLVSPVKAAYDRITFYACANDAYFPYEHFGVAVSTTGNTDASDFVTIQEWNMSAKSQGVPTGDHRGGSRYQGNWYEYTTDLSFYNGQEIWVAIRHFNCSDWDHLNVDDITLTCPSSFLECLEGETCTLTATANEGYVFASWTENGVQVSTEPIFSFQVTGDRSLVANFAVPYVINATPNLEEGGTVSGGGICAEGSVCTLTATANDGFVFINWTDNGEVVSSAADYSFVVSGNRDLVANFSIAHDINVTCNPVEGGSVSGGGVCAVGSECTLVATAHTGYTFVNWTENGEVVSTEPWYSFTVTEDRNLVANFDVLYFDINVTVNPAEGGMVSGFGTYIEGAVCTLTATASEGYRFVSWTKNRVVMSWEETYSFTVWGDMDLVANFSSAEDNRLGNTTYDWQSNSGARTWTHVWPDGKVNFAFTQSTTSNYSDRGTGIGTYDAANDEWIPSTARVENERTGFGSIAQYGENGIVVASHTATECHVFIVPDKDDVPVNSLVPVSVLDNTNSPSWPAVMTSGPNRDIIHVVATANSNNVPGMGSVTNPIIYFRSTDGGQTWDKENVVLPYLTPEYAISWGSNCFYWMETTEDNCLALVVNNPWSDGMVIYSYDDGETWERKVFYKHPNPFGYIGSTFYYPRWTSCQWDSQHRLHVLYEFNGNMGDPGSGNFYPTMGGVAYWNETMPYNSSGVTVSSIEGNLVPGQPFVMESAYIERDIYSTWWWNNYTHEMWPEYIGYLSPLTDDGYPEDPYSESGVSFNIGYLGSHGTYNQGICAFPVLCMVPGTDEMVAVWSAMDENHTDAGGNYYYKIFASYSPNGGISWSPMVHLTNDPAFDYAEFIYNQAAVVGRKLIIASQTDTETGSFVMGNESVFDNNFYRGFVFDIDETFDTTSPELFTVNVTSNSTESGTARGTGTYPEGSKCTASAIPNVGYTFVNWTENGEVVSTEPRYSFTVTGNRNLVANFDVLYFDVNVMVNPAEGGTVSGVGPYIEGTECTLTATANEGYRFVSWTKNMEVMSWEETYSFTVWGDTELVANFSCAEDNRLGNTTYDWQSNSGARTWTHVWPDGKVSFAFTQSTTSNFTDRGTGIGTYDAANDEWIPSTGRVENERTGFGSIAQYGENGIVVASHTATECHVFIVPDKDDVPVNSLAPVSVLDNTNSPSWPAVMTSGPNRDIIHVVATANSNNVPGMESVTNPIIYFRSTDGGQTWDKENVVLPYLTPEYAISWGSNRFYWMETTEDNCLALVVNNPWSDGMVIYSYDDGETWERKVFYKHPNPFGYFDNMFYYPRWTSCQWDSQHRLHVLYEYNASMGDPGSGNFYPKIGGVAYWNETMPYNSSGVTVSAIEGNLVPGQPFVMESAYIERDIQLSWWIYYDATHEMWPEYIGYLSPLTDDGYPEDPYSESGVSFNIGDLGMHGTYNQGICAFPVLCMVPGTDEMVAVWSAMDENHTDAVGNYYYKIFASYSPDGGVSWSPMVHLTNDPDFDYAEFIYNQAAVVGRKLIIASQTDRETGVFVMGNESVFDNNFYRGFVFDIDEIFNLTTPSMFTVNATSNPTEGGTVSGVGSYTEGAECTLTATANSPHTFINWTENGEVVSTQPTISFPVTANRNLVANFTHVQNTTLNEGWTWYSTYIELNGLNGLELMEEGLNQNGVMIKSQKDGFLTYDCGQWLGTLNAVNNESMYQINVNAPCVLNMVGAAAIPSQHPISLASGWNWIGYPSAHAAGLDVAFSSLNVHDGDLVKSKEDFSQYIEGVGWIGGLNVLTPGIGLMYHSLNSQNMSFVFAQGSVDGAIGKNVNSEGNHFAFTPSVYPFNMSVMAVVELDGVELRDNQYELAAFANGECRGSARLLFVEPFDRYLAFLTVAGDETTMLEMKLYDRKTDKVYESADPVVFETNAILGGVKEPFVLRFNTTMTSNDSFFITHELYPNPVGTGETLRINGTSCSNPVRIEVVNALGEVVSTEVATCFPTSLKAPKVPGVYTVRFTMGDNGNQCYKLIVK